MREFNEILENSRGFQRFQVDMLAPPLLQHPLGPPLGRFCPAKGDLATDEGQEGRLAQPVGAFTSLT